MELPEEIWNLLHDGSIADLRGTVPGDLTLRVEIEYLTRRMTPPCAAIDVTLLGCDRFEYLHWSDDRRSTDAALLPTLETDILSASAIDEGVRVICSDGQFDIRYDAVQLARDDGSPCTIAEISDAATRYWDDFEARRVKRQETS